MKLLSLFVLLFTPLSWGEDTSRAIGSYANGRLENGVTLPDTADGFLKLFLPRNRGWGTFSLNQLLLLQAHQTKLQFPDSERLQVGDVSAEHGGAISGHDSHQIGLDADVVYLRVNRMEQDPLYTETFIENFVINNALTKNFDTFRNEWLFRSLVATGKINRIFVDTAVKKFYCTTLQERNEELTQNDIAFLRRLRPWPNHYHHLHVRIQCPENSPQCIPQVAPPEGTGCDNLEPMANEMDGF